VQTSTSDVIKGEGRGGTSFQHSPDHQLDLQG